jgi:hypothetical protein
MTTAADVRRLVEAATGLDIRPRARRWAHLPVCVLDAVFSINARYTSTIAVCDRYAKRQGLVPNLVDVATVAGTAAEVLETGAAPAREAACPRRKPRCATPKSSPAPVCTHSAM